LLSALARGRPAVRQTAADTLAELADARVLDRLRALIEDSRRDLAVRQAAVSALGRSGRKASAGILIDQLGGDEGLRRAAAEALTDLSGQTYGTDMARWRAWWERHKDLSNECWLEVRLGYQAGRARRLEADLERSRGQVIRLHHQLHNALPAADRLAHLQTL